MTNAAGNATRFRVADDGAITAPGLAAVPGTFTGLCVETATGKVGTCSVGTLTSIAAGTGLSGGTITTSGTLSADTSYLQRRVNASCLTGSSISSIGADGSVTCQASGGTAGTVTSVATGIGLTGGTITTSGTIGLAATQLLPIASCATNQFPEWNGSAWNCAANLTLAATSTAGAGSIFKGASRFIHSYGTGNTFVGGGAGNYSMTGAQNTAIGGTALQGNSSGGNNTATGFNVLTGNTTGANNTASGANALSSNVAGSRNTAAGVNALLSSDASDNTALGFLTLRSNATGTGNTAVGSEALRENLGSFNTSTGYQALMSNTTGTGNTASGYGALSANSGGNSNTAIGSQALFVNAVGGQNTATGHQALFSSSGATHNTAIGYQAMYGNTLGNGNVALGSQALHGNTSSGNTAIGYGALYSTTGANNIGIGNTAGQFLTTGSNNIAIGNDGVGAESDTIRVGSTQTKAFIAGIRGIATVNANAVAVLIDSAGQLGTASSSRRVKDDIADMDAASGALMRLRPVTFHYKSDRNPAGRTLQYGLIAEEVAEVYPGLVAHAADGQVETVMYQYLPSMLLNEYQKQQRRIEAQARHIADLELERRTQAAEIAGLKAAVGEVAELKRRTERLAGALDRLEAARPISTAETSRRP